MKRLLALMFAAVMALSLMACGSGSGAGSNNDTNTPSTRDDNATITPTEDKTLKATITTNEGETVEMTAEELIAAYDSNEAKFNKLYQYAKIEFTGTIDYIKVDTSVIVESGSVSTSQQKIVFKEGWCLVLGKDNTKYDLADFDTGDMVKVTTSIVGAPFDTDFLQKVSDNNRVIWLVGNDKIHGGPYSTIETVMNKDYSELADEQNQGA